MQDYKRVLSFWFDRKDTSAWFKKNKKFDVIIKKRFELLIRAAKRGSLKSWEKNPKSCLALILLLDQFTRNVYRDKKEAFEGDGLSQKIVLEAIKKKFDKKLTKNERMFLYMPLMHAENLEMHKISMSLFKKLGNKNTLNFAREHEDLIKKFGRYPHRNKILGRISTAKEKKYLATPEAGF